MTQPDTSRGKLAGEGSAPRQLRGDRGALSRLTAFLFETPTDPLGWFNTACTRIAIVMLAGIAAIYLETFL